MSRPYKVLLTALPLVVLGLVAAQRTPVAAQRAPAQRAPVAAQRAAAETRLQYYPLPSPIRLLDTRPGATACDAPGTPLAADGVRTEPAGTSCSGIPANAQAIVGTATVVNNLSGATSGFITLYPSGVDRPTVLNLGYVANQVVTNEFTVGL